MPRDRGQPLTFVRVNADHAIKLVIVFAFKTLHLRRLMNQAFTFATISLHSQNKDFIALFGHVHHLAIMMKGDFILHVHGQGPVFANKDPCTKYNLCTN